MSAFSLKGSFFLKYSALLFWESAFVINLVWTLQNSSNIEQLCVCLFKKRNDVILQYDFSLNISEEIVNFGDYSFHSFIYFSIVSHDYITVYLVNPLMVDIWST